MVVVSPMSGTESATSARLQALAASVVHDLDDAVVVCSTTGEVVLVNAAAQALTPDVRPGVQLAGSSLAALPEARGVGGVFAVRVAGRSVSGRHRHTDDGHEVFVLRTGPLPASDSAAADLPAGTVFLAEAGRRLAGSLHPKRCARQITQLAVDVLADAALVVLPPVQAGGGCQVVSTRSAVGDRVVSWAELTAVPGLAEALEGFPPVPSRWLDPASAPGWLVADGPEPVTALLVTPLPGNATPAGVLILLRREPGVVFTAADERLARSFAGQAGAALAAAELYQEQVETTRVLQSALLPPHLPQTAGMELAATYRPARDGLLVGGDFYDVFPAAEPGGDTMLVLGDVCGKGVEAAVLTGRVRQTLRALRLAGLEPDAMLTVLNQALLDTDGLRRFVTLVLAAVTRQPGGRLQLGFSTGGHPPPLVLRADARVEETTVRGTVIGAIPAISTTTAKVTLQPGEVCVLFSDGLFETRGGPTGTEPFGDQRLAAALATCAGMPVTALVERLTHLVSDWANSGLRDDITVLAVRAPDRQHPNAANVLGKVP